MNQIIDFISKIFDTSDFNPRWICGEWSDFHGWLYICSSLGVWSAYFTIPLILFYFISRKRDIPFSSVFILFILFILLCGSTHLVDAIIFWFPHYRINTVLITLTAVVSWITVFAMIKILPSALQLKTPEQLQEIVNQKTEELNIANKRLSESESQFRALVNSNPNVIARISRDLRFKFINNSISKISKYKPEELIGKHILDVENGSMQLSEEFASVIKDAIESKRSLRIERTVTTTLGKEFCFLIDVIPLVNSDSLEAEDILTITADITSQKKNETQLKRNIEDLNVLSKKLSQKNKVLEDFAYIVSHNLRSPVNNLNSLLSLLDKESDEEGKNYIISKIKEVNDRLTQTVYDLTEVVRIRQSTDIEKVDIRFEDIFHYAKSCLAAQVLESKPIINFDFSACESINYPKVYIESIMLNLLSNAIKYRSPERTLVINFRTTLEGDYVIMICEDNGLGIDLNKYGNKLFNLNKTFHDHPDSKGVGLFITKNQIESLGGSIMAESEVNVGTKFIIKFKKDGQ